MTDRLVLGSASPRRHSLLRAAGIDFEVHAVDLDERELRDDDVVASVERSARAKFAALAGLPQLAGRMLMTADTLVAATGAVAGKPVDDDDAMTMLAALSGQVLDIASAVCLGRADASEPPRSQTLITRVQLRSLSAVEIAAYVGTGAAADKAGGLELQGRASEFIETVDGCWSNVVGLPVCLVDEMLGGGGDCSGLSCGASA